MVTRKHLTSILLPTAYRPRELARCLNALYNTLDNHSVEVLISPVSDDPESTTIARDYSQNGLFVRSMAEYERGAVWAWNELAKHAQGDVLALFADDLVPNPCWLTCSLNRLDAIGNGLIGFNDLGTNGNIFAAHFIVSRDFLRETMGGVIFPPQYHCWWCDREISDKARANGKHVWAQDAIVEHVHYTWGKSRVDRTYTDSIPYHELDRVLYETRKANGFPIDYEGYL